MGDLILGTGNLLPHFLLRQIEMGHLGASLHSGKHCRVCAVMFMIHLATPHFLVRADFLVRYIGTGYTQYANSIQNVSSIRAVLFIWQPHTS